MRGLDYAAERYVRIYTRDTPDFLLLSWEAQALHLALQRKLDRAGVLEHGDNPPARAVAAVLRWPVPVVEPALAELVASGFLEMRPGFLVDPTFIEAQESKQNDAARARASRERRRARATAAAAGLPVTNRDESVRGSSDTPEVGEPERSSCAEANGGSVTRRDASNTKRDSRSRSERKRHSVPSLAVPSRAEESSSSRLDADARAVFDFWKQDTGHSRACFDRKRKTRIQARLREGFTVDELKAAIRNRRNDDWLMGRDPKSTRVYDGLETLLRDAAQVERLRDLKSRPVNGAHRVQGGPSPDLTAAVEAGNALGSDDDPPPPTAARRRSMSDPAPEDEPDPWGLTPTRGAS